MYQENSQSNLYEKNDPQNPFELLCFMAKKLLPDDGTNATAYNC